MNLPPRNLSCFSGAGGLDIGMEAAGFQTIGCIEWDSYCRETLALNRPDWNIYKEGNIEDFVSDLTPETLNLKKGELDLLSGAPPCQPYSKAALWHKDSRKGAADARATPLKSFLKLAEILYPKYILIENVPSFVRGEVSALKCLEVFAESLGYKCEHKILDSYDFGVPQHRKRAIIIMYRCITEIVWPQELPPQLCRNAWDAIGGLTPSSHFKPMMTGKWAKLLPSIPEGHNYQWHTEKGGGSALFGYRTRYWNFLLKLAKNKPSWTIAAQPGPSTGPFHWENRPLTIQEAALLQTFPKGWSFSGSHREQLKQVGNATPPLLAEYIGRMIIKSLGLNNIAKSPKLELKRNKTCPSPGGVSDVPNYYKQLGNIVKAHPGTGKGPAPRTQ